MFTLSKLNRHAAALFLTIVLLHVSSSCGKKLDIVASNAGADDTQWASVSDTRAALMGIYGLLRAAMVDNYAHWVYGEMRYGDLVPYIRADLRAVADNRLNASFPIVKELSNWRRFYAVINAAALFIERAPAVLAVDRRYTERDLKFDIAQARTIRAFAYFYMVRIWGDVPLLTRSYDDGIFAEVARTPERTVLAFAEEELLAAAQELPYLYAEGSQQYYGEGFNTWVGVLVNKISAYTILAHLCAWQGKYLNAEVYARFALANAQQSRIVAYSVNDLVNRTSGLFAPSDKNQILAIRASYVFSEATATGHIESLSLAYPLVTRTRPDIYVPKDTINKLFLQASDTRFGVDTISGLITTNYFTDFNGDIPIFSKINVIRAGDGDPDFSLFGSNIVFSRLEELQLLYAEICAVLGNTDEAMLYLNFVRSNRGTSPFIMASGSDLVDEIFAERRRELMGEGWRWYDQVRHARIKRNNPTVNTLIEEGGIFWPISGEVLQRNRKLIQNAYWR
ncbi:RagB/SusD family nutrient uptake outer membrane protein [Sphingobacterium griseoflavum]|uniref:Starch-binding protein n=2 Tax=Sphingobacterium griseoflavum TaxID=1474952 RepID=A0ABQ3HVG5_9SPHI|nr:starch-binding protein [Sphingobacterium griseoflavum]